MLTSQKRFKTEIYLQWKSNRKLHMAYQMTETAVTLNDLEGYSPVAGLFKCNPSNICAAVYTISTDSVLARFLCISRASCFSFRWVGLCLTVDGLGWIVSKKMQPCPSLESSMSVRQSIKTSGSIMRPNYESFTTLHEKLAVTLNRNTA